MGFNAQPLPNAAENQKHPHRAGGEAAVERLRRKVQSRAPEKRTLVSKPVQVHSLPKAAYLLEHVGILVLLC